MTQLSTGPPAADGARFHRSAVGPHPVLLRAAIDDMISCADSVTAHCRSTCSARTSSRLAVPRRVRQSPGAPGGQAPRIRRPPPSGRRRRRPPPSSRRNCTRPAEQRGTAPGGDRGRHSQACLGYVSYLTATASTESYPWWRPRRSCRASGSTPRWDDAWPPTRTRCSPPTPRTPTRSGSPRTTTGLPRVRGDRPAPRRRGRGRRDRRTARGDDPHVRRRDAVRIHVLGHRPEPAARSPARVVTSMSRLRRVLATSAIVARPR